MMTPQELKQIKRKRNLAVKRRLRGVMVKANTGPNRAQRRAGMTKQNWVLDLNKPLPDKKQRRGMTKTEWNRLVQASAVRYYNDPR